MSEHMDRLDQQDRRDALDRQRDELNMRDCALTPEAKAEIQRVDQATLDDEDTRCANCNHRRRVYGDMCRECMDYERNYGDW